jgi:excisionase family DNA binding protein
VSTDLDSILALALPDISRIFSYRPNRAVRSRMDSDIMTIREIAEYLKLTEKTAYRLTAEGKIPGFKVGGAWRFKRSDIDAWIETKKTERGGE